MKKLLSLMKVPERLWRIQYKITSTCSICKLFKSILFKGKGRHNYFYACFQKICHHVNFFLVQNDFTVMTTRHRHGIFGSATASSKSQVRVATIFILPSFHIHIQQYYEFGNNWIVQPNQDLFPEALEIIFILRAQEKCTFPFPRERQFKFTQRD